MKKRINIFIKITLVFLFLVLVGCNRIEGTVKKEEISQEDEETVIEEVTVTLSPQQEHQTIESFGASGAWWSQDVGGWTEKETEELTKREYIAELLFDRENGIGLSSYRYNLGAGSTRENSSKITDPWRRAESFEVSPGQYDWSKDANAQWVLNSAVDYGIDDIYFFVNSPLTRLTKNGSAYGDMVDGVSSNLEAENYYTFAKYVYDVTEHFLEEDVPVTHISPINEPQWEWIGGQEGTHYDPDEMVALLKVFIEEKEKRESLNDIYLSMPELGEWGNSSYPYYEAMIADKQIMNYFDTWEIHSYWSNQYAKSDFINWLKEHDLQPNLKMSEWTEMVNGRDYTMNSALNLANQIYEDMTILDVSVWQYWIAVSSYDYRDGLIYVDLDTKDISLPKRLWTMGNFSKFVRPGYTRITSTVDNKEINSVSFVGINDEGEEETITILINNGFEAKEVNVEGEDYQKLLVYVTDSENDLSKEVVSVDSIVVPRQSVVTVQGIK